MANHKVDAYLFNRIQQHFCAGVTISQIARTYHLSPTTVVKWLDRLGLRHDKPKRVEMSGINVLVYQIDPVARQTQAGSGRGPHNFIIRPDEGQLLLIHEATLAQIARYKHLDTAIKQAAYLRDHCGHWNFRAISLQHYKCLVRLVQLVHGEVLLAKPAKWFWSWQASETLFRCSQLRSSRQRKWIPVEISARRGRNQIAKQVTVAKQCGHRAFSE